MNTITGATAASLNEALLEKSPLSSKGSIGNKVEYMGETMKEFKKFQLKSGLTLAGGAAVTAAATTGVAKSKKAQEIVKKFGKKILDNKYVQKGLDEVKPLTTKATSYIKKLPKPAKAVLAAGAALTALIVSNQAGKTERNLGKIDQKYTDKAKVQDILG